jgi:hypothetical protein
MKRERNVPAILELIPERKLSFEQTAFTAYNGKSPFPIYTLRREPRDFDDFKSQRDSKLTIWRENGTLICIGDRSFRIYEERNVSFWIHNNRDQHGSSCTIYGKTDAAIAETATWFWSLQRSGKNDAGQFTTTLTIQGCNNDFDFAIFSPDQLAHILDANPSQQLELHSGTWSAAQSTVLATRNYPMNLALYFDNKSPFGFEDDGTEFLNSLEKRQSSFGSLSMYWDERYHEMSFSTDNQRRLCNLEVIDTLRLDPFCFCVKDLKLLSLAAKVNALDYKIKTVDLEPEDLESFDVVTKDLCLEIRIDKDWDETFIAILDRMAAIGHFECLKLAPCWDEDADRHYAFEDMESVADALVRVINGNPKLTCLDLGQCDESLVLEPHLHTIFKAMEKHTALTTFIVRHITTDYHPAFKALERLLSRNRNITVLNERGKRCSNGPILDQLYALNGFYNGSAALVKESTPSRPPLVATALTECASECFLYTALLLSNHTDALCEIMSGVNLDRVATTLKRTRRVQPSRASKKAARTEM